MKNYDEDKFHLEVEVSLKSDEDFLKVKETLQRIGIASKHENKLFQSCHILHKRNRYFIVHFKQLFELDGKSSTITHDDIKRRNTICKLLHQWELLEILDMKKIEDCAPLSSIKVLSFSEKQDWDLIQKYQIGSKKKR